MSKYYAVANGYQTGIFSTWAETEPLVKGYKGCKYKSFKTLEEAQCYLGVITPLYTNPINSRAPNQAQKNKIDNQNAVIYTDGSCVNRVGGFGYVIIRNDVLVPVCGRVPTDPCTNQIAELYAIYSAINYVLTHHKQEIVAHGIVIYTDSKYSIGCLTNWNYNWKRNGWINSKGEPVSNKELIQDILYISTGIKIEYQHVKAHNGNKYNEWADRLANDGRTV